MSTTRTIPIGLPPPAVEDVEGLEEALAGKQASDADLTAIAALATTGLAVRTGTSTWATRSIVAGANVTVTNGDGVAGDITIAATGGSSNADTLDGYDSTAFARKAENAAITGQWDFSNSVAFAGNTAVGTGGDLTVSRGMGQHSFITFGDGTGHIHYDTTNINLVPNTGVVKANGNMIWHAGNDGAGSGLDADKLDGYDSVAFPRKAENAAITGQWDFQNAVLLPGESQIDAFGGMVLSNSITPTTGRLWFGNTGMRSVGYDGTQYTMPGAELLINGGTAWHSGNDGAGSSLDADLLDGLDSTSFAQSRPMSDYTANAGFLYQSGMYLATVTTGIPGAYAGGQILTIHGTGNTVAQMVFGGPSNAGPSFRHGTISPTFWNPWWEIIHSGNDGAGSGVDADLLDGYDSAAFPRKAENAAITGQWSFNNTVEFCGGSWINSSGSLMLSRSDLPDGGTIFFGNSGSHLFYFDGTNFHIAGGGLLVGGSSVWNTGNDGAGSGLDADTLDGLQPHQIGTGHELAHGSTPNFNTFLNTDLWGSYYVGPGSTNGPGDGTGYYHWRWSLGSEYNNYSLQMATPRIATGGNPYLWYRQEEGGVAGGWGKFWVGYADNAGMLDGIDNTGFGHNAHVTVSTPSNNLDNALQAGFFRFDTPANAPPGVVYSNLIVAHNPGNDTTGQIAINYANGEVWSRGANVGVTPYTTWARHLTDQNSPTGIYAPTATGDVNCTGATVSNWLYVRHGPYMVMVSGRASITASALGTCRCYFTLPIASDFTGAYDALGAGGNSVFNLAASITADLTNNAVRIEFAAPSAGSFPITFMFMYRIM